MIRVLLQAVRREDVHSALTAEGFERAFDPPASNTRRTTEWHRGDEAVLFSTNIESGLALFIVLGGEQASCAAMLERHWATRSAAETVERLANATSIAERAGGALALRDLGQNLRFDAELSRERIASALQALLTSNDVLLQTAAVDASFDLRWAELTDGVHGVASAIPALAWTAEMWDRERAREEEAQRAREEAVAKAARLEELPMLVEGKRWDEALSLSQAIFSEGKKPPVEAWRARALALIGLGRMTEGAVFAAGWSTVKGDGETESAKVLAEVGARLTDAPATELLHAVQEVLTARDNANKVGNALAKLASFGEHRPAELDFAIASVKLRKSYERGVQREALPHAERAAKGLRGHLASTMLLGLAQAACDERDGAEASYRRALELVKSTRSETAREAALTRFDRKLDHAEEGETVVTAQDVYGALTRLFLTADRFDAFAAVVDEAIKDSTVDAAGRASLLYSRAMQATEAKRHEAATKHYPEAIAAERLAGKEPSGTLRFNLACELAKTGRGEEALAPLREAIAIRRSYADDARTDDYFESIWDTSEFVRVVAPWSEPPTKEAVEQSIQRALGRTYRGEGEEALEESHRAVSGAELLGDDALLVRALEKFGSALTYHASPERGIRVLQRAVQLARPALAHAPRDRAAALHALGAAFHAAERFDEAEAHYKEALADRIASDGEESESVAISYGDLARLAMGRERHEEAEVMMVKTIRILEATLTRTTGEDRWDALVNLSLVQGNRVAAAIDRGCSVEEVLGLGEETLARLEAITLAGARIPSGVIVRLRRALVRALPAELSEELTPRVAALGGRLLELEEPNPVVRAERLYWQNLRAACIELRNKGNTDEAIAEAISRAVRGQEPGEPIGSHPAFRNLSVELAQRLSSRTDLVMVAMALDLACGGHEPIEKALERLQEFAIANSLGQGADTIDPTEADEDALNEDEDNDDDGE